MMMNSQFLLEKVKRKKFVVFVLKREISQIQPVMNSKVCRLHLIYLTISLVSVPVPVNSTVFEILNGKNGFSSIFVKRTSNETDENREIRNNCNNQRKTWHEIAYKALYILDVDEESDVKRSDSVI